MRADNDNDNLAGDILRGANAIAAHLGFPRRAVYHLVSKGNLPTFRMGETVCRMGETVCARKSTLVGWIAEQEARAAA